jgi:hypothetical protein
LLHQEDSEASESEDEDGSEDSEGSDEGSYSEEDSEDGEDEAEGDLKDLLNNLPANLRQQVLKKEAAAKRRRAGEQVEESEEESEEEEEGDEGWGRKKKTYWEGDTADLEIGQEMEDALEEEEAAQEMQREKAKRMKASDFMDEFEASGSSDSSASDSDDSAEEWGVKNGRGKSGGSATVGDLAQVALGQDEMESDAEVPAVKVEKLTKNISHLSKQQRLDMVRLSLRSHLYQYVTF